MLLREFTWAGLLVVLAPDLAVASCPTGSETEPGILLTRIEPFFSSLVKQGDEGVTIQNVRDKVGSPARFAHFAQHPLAIERHETAMETLSMAYSENVSSIADLETTKIWRSDVTLFTGEQQIAVGVYELRFKGQGREDIGGCQYDTWVVDSVTDFEGREPIRFELHYSPTLNYAIRSVRLHPNGEPSSEVRYDKIEIADP